VLLTVVVIAGAIVGGYRLAHRDTPASPASPATALQIQPLTITGSAAGGALSPDGKFVAYVHRDGAEFSIWVRQLATGSDVPIVPVVPGRRFSGLVVTPDGNYVDFVARQPGVDAGDLWRVPFLGGTPRQLISSVWSATGWAPDGRHMAFIREDSSTAVSVVIADADGANERVLATRRVPQVFYSSYTVGPPIARPSWSMDAARSWRSGRHSCPRAPAGPMSSW